MAATLASIQALISSCAKDIGVLKDVLTKIEERLKTNDTLPGLHMILSSTNDKLAGSTAACGSVMAKLKEIEDVEQRNTSALQQAKQDFETRLNDVKRKNEQARRDLATKNVEDIQKAGKEYEEARSKLVQEHQAALETEKEITEQVRVQLTEAEQRHRSAMQDAQQDFEARLKSQEEAHEQARQELTMEHVEHKRKADKEYDEARSKLVQEHQAALETEKEITEQVRAQLTEVETQKHVDMKKVREDTIQELEARDTVHLKQLADVQQEHSEDKSSLVNAVLDTCMKGLYDQTGNYLQEHRQVWRRQTQERMGGLRHSIEIEKAVNTGLQSEVKKLNLELLQASPRIRDLEEEVEGLRTDSTAMKKRYEKAFAQYAEEKTRVMKEQESSVGNMKQQLQEAYAENLELTEERDSLREKEQSWEQSFLSRSIKKDEAVNSERQLLAREGQRLRGDNEELKKRTAVAEKTANKAQIEAVTMTAEKLRAEVEIARLHTLLACQQRDANQDILSQIGALINGNKATKDKNESKLEERLEEVMTLNSALEKEQVQLGRNLRSAEHSSAMLVVYNKGLQSHFSAKLKQKTNEIVSLQRYIDGLETEVYEYLIQSEFGPEDEQAFDEELHMITETEVQDKSSHQTKLRILYEPDLQGMVKGNDGRRGPSPILGAVIDEEESQELEETIADDMVENQERFVGESNKNRKNSANTAEHDHISHQVDEAIYASPYQSGQNEIRRKEQPLMTSLNQIVQQTIEQTPEIPGEPMNGLAFTPLNEQGGQDTIKERQRRGFDWDSTTVEVAEAMPPPAKRIRYDSMQQSIPLKSGERSDAGSSSSRRSSRLTTSQTLSHTPIVGEKVINPKTQDVESSKRYQAKPLAVKMKEMEDATAKADRIWAMIKAPQGMTDSEKEYLHSKIVQAFNGTSKPEFEDIMERIDKYTFGTCKEWPEMPRPCFAAAVLKRDAGKGGSSMTSKNCKFCNSKGNGGSVCCWASFAEGVDTGYGARDQNGKVYETTWNLESKVKTVSIEESSIRWILTKRL